MPKGNAPLLPNAEKKIWWPHTEALYALLLAYELTGESWCEEWYNRVHDWSFAHFPMPECGEWCQRLDREGNPTAASIALPVKDPFHLPRAAILILQLLSEPASRPRLKEVAAGVTDRSIVEHFGAGSLVRAER